jgi:hypothetical protein
MAATTYRAKQDTPRCYCGHAQRTHIEGSGLCLSCNHPLCLLYRPQIDLWIDDGLRREDKNDWGGR